MTTRSSSITLPPANEGSPLTRKELERMARRRFQRGSLIPRHGKPKDGLWRGRWREDVNTNGVITRPYVWEIIGPLEEYPTRRLAERALEIRLQQINSPSYRPQISATFKEFADRWKTNTLATHKLSSQSSEKSRLKNHLVPFFGKHLLKEITAGMVQEFVASNKCGAKTVKNCIGTLRLIWNEAVRDKYITKDHDWFEDVRLPEVITGDQPSFTIEEIQRIIVAAEEPFKTFYWILGETGIRLGEGCGLQVRAIDLQRKLVVIRYSAWQGKIGTTKAKKPRLFDISDALAAHLEKFVISDNPESFLFSTKNGTPWNGSDLVKDHLRPLLLKLKIKTVMDGDELKVMEGVGAHAFRHGNSSVMDKLNIPAKVRQDRLGHYDFQRLTLSTYTHADSQDHRDAANKLGEIFAPVVQ